MFGLVVVWNGSRHDPTRGLLCVEPHPTKPAPPRVRLRPVGDTLVPEKVLLAFLAQYGGESGLLISEIASALDVPCAVVWGQLSHCLETGKVERVPVPRWEREAKIRKAPLFRYRRV